LAADRKTVALNIPPVTIQGLARTPALHFNFDAKAIDAMLQRLSRLRVKMEPRPQRH